MNPGSKDMLQWKNNVNLEDNPRNMFHGTSENKNAFSLNCQREGNRHSKFRVGRYFLRTETMAQRSSQS